MILVSVVNVNEVYNLYEASLLTHHFCAIPPYNPQLGVNPSGGKKDPQKGLNYDRRHIGKAQSPTNLKRT